jgi:FkbM family methyltransferase
MAGIFYIVIFIQILINLNLIYYEIYMLIPYHRIQHILSENNISITGAFHIGAHECEELSFYQQLNLDPTDIIWIDAIPQKVDEAKQRGIPNMYHTVITDKDNEDITFHVSNNGQSSSVLEFGTHSQEHPWVTYVEDLSQKSTTIQTFIKENNIKIEKHNFWNFDIQGAELMALKGAGDLIQTAAAIYLEVNEKELYRGCGLIGEIDSFLSTYGFTRVATEMTVHGWGDALYIK